MNEELPLCECGCGEPVTKKGNRFLQGHSGGRGSKITPKSEPQLCECGCGEYALPGNDYIMGHQNIGKKATLKTKLLLSEIRKDVPLSNTHKLAIAKSHIGIPLSKNHCKAISEGNKGKIISPSHQLAISEGSKGISKPCKPEHRTALSKSLKKSKIAKTSHKKQIGGLDIVKHHIAYDFGRPKALTVKITRKFHSQIHHPKGIQFGTYGYSLID